MKQISQRASFFIKRHSPSTVITIMSATKRGRGKTYAVEETREAMKLLEDFKQSEEKVLEKHGWFEENVNENGQLKVKKVYYK